jgi:hypothetical protein
MPQYRNKPTRMGSSYQPPPRCRPPLIGLICLRSTYLAQAHVYGSSRIGSMLRHQYLWIVFCNRGRRIMKRERIAGNNLLLQSRNRFLQGLDQQMDNMGAVQALGDIIPPDEIYGVSNKTHTQELAIAFDDICIEANIDRGTILVRYWYHEISTLQQITR